MRGPSRCETGWTNGTRAHERLGVSVAALYKLAARGLIKIKANPGEPLRYSAADVERLAQARQQDA